MSRFKLSSQATQDIEDIWLYIAQNSPQSADNLLDKMLLRFSRLAQFPELGRVRSDVAPFVRSFPVSSYIVFYRPIEQGIEIVRVVHGSRDIGQIFQVTEDMEQEETEEI